MKAIIQRFVQRFRKVYYSGVIQNVIYNTLCLLFILLSLATIVSGINLFLR